MGRSIGRAIALCSGLTYTVGARSGRDTGFRSPARYLWAMLLARLFEIFPLTCPHCGGEVRILAFITEARPVQSVVHRLG